jgi:hypothetical protein
MGVLLVGLETILYVMNRLNIYVTFLCIVPDGDSQSAFESSLVQFYATLFRFLLQSVRLYQKPSINRGFQSLWTPGNITSFEDAVKELAQRVDQDASNCDRTLREADQIEAAAHRKKELEAIDEFRNSLNRIEVAVEGLWKEYQADKAGIILQWASCIPYKDNHDAAREGRTPNTGTWMLQHKQFETWKNADSSMILWIHGIRKPSVVVVKKFTD